MYASWLGALRDFESWIRGDVPVFDTTSEGLGLGGRIAVAKVIAKSGGVAACTDVVAWILGRLGVEVLGYAEPGSRFEPGSIVLAARGDAGLLLGLERTLLDLLSYCFSCATVTAEMIARARAANPRVRVAATRKAPPGLRFWAKLAVRQAGGDTHRLTLSDAVLVKDNHVALIGSVGEAVRRARAAASFAHRVEVEVSSPREALEAAEAGADVVMLDNFTVEEVAEALRLLEERRLRGRVVVEASGGITLENVADYAATGVDVISSSQLTLKLPIWVDISMRVSSGGR